MHTPDGFITSWICIATLLFSSGMIVFCAIRTRKWITKEKAILMAGLSSIIFAFQMLNFSIGNGTSGHLIGGAIAAILLGPEASVLILTSVLLVQTFVYGDGGVLAIGVNILTMGIVAGYTAHWIYQPLKKKMPILSVFLSSWGSVVAASFFAGALLGLSGTISYEKVIPAMVFTHIFIGFGEGLITCSVILYVLNTKQDLIHKQDFGNLIKYTALSTLGAMVIMSFALPFASDNPDGLEKVALNLGFYEKATEVFSISPMPDYTFLGEEGYFFGLMSGITGMMLTFGAGYGIARTIGTLSSG